MNELTTYEELRPDIRPLTPAEVDALRVAAFGSPDPGEDGFGIVELIDARGGEVARLPTDASGVHPWWHRARLIGVAAATTALLGVAGVWALGGSAGAPSLTQPEAVIPTAPAPDTTPSPDATVTPDTTSPSEATAASSPATNVLEPTVAPSPSSTIAATTTLDVGDAVPPAAATQEVLLVLDGTGTAEGGQRTDQLIERMRADGVVIVDGGVVSRPFEAFEESMLFPIGAATSWTYTVADLAGIGGFDTWAMWYWDDQVPAGVDAVLIVGG